MDVKIHIPGETINGVQRCVRCHAKLNEAPNKWATSVPVSSDGRGNMSVRIPEGSRQCGRKQVVNG